MTDTPPPERTWWLKVGLQGMDGIVQWVQAGATLEERKVRVARAKEAIEAVLASVDRESFNRAVREQARRLQQGGGPN